MPGWKQKARKRLRQRYNGNCVYCGATPGKRRLTIEHVVPTSRGGKDSQVNLASACFNCNTCKGDLLVDEFRALILKRAEEGVAPGSHWSRLTKLVIDGAVHFWFDRYQFGLTRRDELRVYTASKKRGLNDEDSFKEVEKFRQKKLSCKEKKYERNLFSEEEKPTHVDNVIQDHGHALSEPEGGVIHCQEDSGPRRG